VHKWTSCYMIYIFCPFWINFSTGDVHKNLLSYYGFHENWFSESHTLLEGINEFLCIFSTFIIWFGCSLVYIMMLNVCCPGKGIPFLWVLLKLHLLAYCDILKVNGIFTKSWYCVVVYTIVVCFIFFFGYLFILN